MPLINTLLQRAQRSRDGVYVDRPWDSLENSKQAHIEKCWLAWVRAESAVRNGDYRTASGWIAVAHRLLAEKPDALCSAEVSATHAHMLEAVGEFRDAMGYAMASFEKWFGFAETMANWDEVESVRALLRVLAEADKALDLDDQRLRFEWMADRLSISILGTAKAVIRLCAPLGDPGPAEDIHEKMTGWFDKNLRPDGPLGPFAPVSRADFVGSIANLYDQLGMPQRSLDMFVSALEMLKGVPDHPQVTEMRNRYQFNAANQMGKTGRNADAVVEFDRLAEVFGKAGQTEPAIRARHAAVVNRWKMGDTAEAKAQLESIVLEYETRREKTRDRRERVAIQQNLSQAYSLWLSIAAAEGGKNDLAKRRILGLLTAMRENSWRFNLMWSRAFESGEPKKMYSDVEMLDARLSKRSDSVLLIIEQGVDQLVFVTVSSGSEPLKERVAVAGGSPELTEALVELLRLYRRVTNQIIDRQIGVISQRHDRFDERCMAAWSQLPDPIKAALSKARTLYVSPSNAGMIDEIPIELLHDGTDHLGLAKIMVRVTSIGQLLETLSPNRVNRVSSGRGLIVEAGEIKAFGHLPGAKAEVARTKKAFDALGATSEVLEAPAAGEFLGALGSDVDLFHFVGHGFADEAGEELFLAEGQRVSAIELAGMGPAPAPVCVLSSCLLGRTRHLSTGEQRGVANAFLRQGAPALIAASYALPDHVGSQFTTAFYFHSRKVVIGEAVRRARQSLASKQYHPAAWASFMLLGEPEATLSLKASSDLPAPDWSSLMIRFLATDSQAYLARVREGLENDAALTGEQREHIVQALNALVDDETEFFTEESLKQRVTFDMTLIERDLTHQLMLLLGAVRRSDNGAASNRQKIRYIGSGLSIEGLFKDSYLAALFAVLYAQVESSPSTSKQGRSLLRRGINALQWLSADAERLAGLRDKLDSWRKHLESGIGISAQELAGVDTETFEAADSGDRQAQKQMLRNLWVRNAAASALASDLPWTYFLQRVIGSGTKQTISDFFGVIERDYKRGKISENRLAILDNLLQQFMGPDEIGEAAEHSVNSEFPEDHPDRLFIELFLLHDRLASGERDVPLDELQTAIRICRKLEANGAETYFAGVWCQHAASRGMLSEALQTAKDTLHALEGLAEADSEYAHRVVLTATMVWQIANHAGDSATVARVEDRYGQQIRALIAAQRK